MAQYTNPTRKQIRQKEIEIKILKTQLEITQLEESIKNVSDTPPFTSTPAMQQFTQMNSPPVLLAQPRNVNIPSLSLVQEPDLKSNAHSTISGQQQLVSEPLIEPQAIVRSNSAEHFSSLDPNAQEFTGYQSNRQPVTMSTDGDMYLKKQTDIVSQLAAALSRRDHLPPMEPEVFEGNMMNFPMWMKSFETLIESNTESPQSRLYYLGKYTSGEAKGTISGYLMLDSPESYERAKQALKTRYGDKYKLGEAFKRELSDWPAIKPGDGIGLRKLAEFLQHCEAAMHSIKTLQCLNTAEENRKILKKLPRSIIDRWGRTVDKWLYGENGRSFNPDLEGEYPPLSVFTQFLAKEARIACGPTSLFLLQEKENPPLKSEREKGRSASSFKSEIEVTQDLVTGKMERKCSLCEMEHGLYSCGSFKNLNYEERKSHCLKKGICFGCLKGGHLKKHCKREGRPLLLIGLPPKQTEPEPQGPEQNENIADIADKEIEAPTEKKAGSFVAEVETTSNSLHSLIIPITVYHSSNPEKKMNTYALLDNQSNACFLDQRLADELNVPSERVHLSLTTMADKRIVPCNLVNGLVIKGVEENSEVKLPGVYTKESIPVDKDLIPRKETINKWPHLKSVANDLPILKEKEVGMLIGFNCSVALMPREVVSAGDYDPYAIRTILGWGVTGNMRPRKQQDNLSHRFALRTHVKEVSPVQIKQMYEEEFNEHGEGKMSQDDFKFLKKVEEITHSDGHFQIPLPLKDETSLPNNKHLAMKRYKGLMNRLARDDKYRADYMKFMEDLIDNGHAERVSEQELKTDGWYIPHHGVYHPHKPNKLRVVFDCSAEYAGKSLNKQLLQGPDQMNSLPGVLCRFRKEKYAFACDIEGMFHQVTVRKQDRNYLRFLWSPRADLSSEPHEYRMTVHLFGATSSPGCAMYALKATADKFQEDCGINAANFVRRGFYSWGATPYEFWLGGSGLL